MEEETFKLLMDKDKIYTLKEKNQKTKHEIAQIYIGKLEDHVLAVTDTWVFQLAPFIIDVLDEEDWDDIDDLMSHHDISKISEVEYEDYCDTPRCYLKGYNENDAMDMLRFNEHIHMNPHHWQYYLVTNSDGTTKPTEIPFPYLLEMLCDWHSYSRYDKNHTAYNYWNDNKDKIIVTDTTRELITDLSRYLQIPLESSEFYRSIEDDEVKITKYLDGLTKEIEIFLSYELGDNDN